MWLIDYGERTNTNTLPWAILSLVLPLTFGYTTILVLDMKYNRCCGCCLKKNLNAPKRYYCVSHDDVCMVYMVPHIARVWINRVRLPKSCTWSAEQGKMNIFLSVFAPESLVSRDGFSSPVPRQPAHLHTQAESGADLRDSSRFPRRRPFIYVKTDIRHRVSPDFIGSLTQLRTDGVHCRESAGTGRVNLKAVPNECCLGRSPWTNYYSPLFPTPTIGMKWACMLKVPAVYVWS